MICGREAFRLDSQTDSPQNQRGVPQWCCFAEAYFVSVCTVAFVARVAGALSFARLLLSRSFLSVAVGVAGGESVRNTSVLWG